MKKKREISGKCKFLNLKVFAFKYSNLLFIIFFLPLITISLTGCSSIVKGITEAIIEDKEKDKDKRVCRVYSPEIAGLNDSLNDRTKKLKVLKIHGIGYNVPGYSLEFVEKLADTLALNRRAEPKLIRLKGLKTNQDAGELMVYKLYDDQNRVLEFYEYSWSKIVENEIKKLDFDKFDINASLRSPLNARVKGFINEISPYALIYIGNTEHRNRILEGIGQSLCWMTSRDFNELDKTQQKPCDFKEPDNIKDARKINYAIFSHSLGSQIAIDGLHSVIPYMEKGRQLYKDDVDVDKYASVKLYMFSNQIPLIQLGKKYPENTGKLKDYCSKGGSRYANRAFSRLEIISFSDPNDLLSYALPDNNTNTNFDSKLCPQSSNVVINVSEVSKIFGVEVANPLVAHIMYKKDERVLAIIKEGVNNKSENDLKKLNCEWIKTEPSF